MVPVEVYTVRDLYAEREDRVGKAAAFACYRCLTGSLTKDPKEVKVWMESYLETDDVGMSGFFAAAVIPLMSFDPPIVDVTAVLTGTKYLTCDPAMYPLATVHGFDVYPGLPDCKLPEIKNLLVSAFLRHTIKAQSDWRLISNPSLVAFIQDSRSDEVHLFEKQADNFVRCH